jgi:hypothetical protein
MIKNTKLGKRAQEEMVGFVLIVVLVAVISLIFLGLSLRQKSQPEMNTQVDNLLSAMLAYTTDCALYMPQYETVGDLIKSCYYNERCSNGKDTCAELRAVMDKLLKAAEGDLTLDKPVKAYELNVSYSAVQQGFVVRRPEAGIVYIKKGICTQNSIGSQQFIPLDTGNIILSLKFCY